MAAQKPYIVMHGCRFVHGFPPDSALTYLFQIPEHRIQKEIGKLNEQICFVGHTHMLEMISYDGQNCTRNSIKKGVMTLDKKIKYLVNIGSVGQPRDKNNNAKYVIWDSSEDTIDVRYVPYDIAAVIKKIQDAGLPEEHAQRLR